jgi:hypothetical protein
MTNNEIPSFWGVKRNQFTEMELALMAGGQSLPEKAKSVNYTFIKNLPTLGPLDATEKGVRAIELHRDSVLGDKVTPTKY